MVLESLSSLQGAEKHPISLFFMAFIIASAAMMLAYRTFPESSSVLSVAFVAVAFMPIIHALFAQEETKEVDENDVPFAFISTHFDLIHMYTWIFIGLIAAYTFWFLVLPETSTGCEGIGCLLPEKSKVFSEQRLVYGGITGKVVGERECFNPGTKNFPDCFELIFTNNAWVMVLALVFSIVWGAGAIFLLAWNASVIGIFIGLEITSRSVEAGVVRAISYLPHGIPEIMAYFLAAIAGGIISAAIAKKQFKPHEMRIVLVDTVLLIALAFVTLLIGAVIETASILGYFDVATAGIIAFAALYFILYMPSVRHRVNTMRKA